MSSVKASGYNDQGSVIALPFFVVDVEKKKDMQHPCDGKRIEKLDSEAWHEQCEKKCRSGLTRPKACTSSWLVG